MSLRGNEQAIRRAFKKALGNCNKVIDKGLIDLLEFGVQQCLKNHDIRHQMHLKTGDSYGWMLLHNGAEVRRKLFAEGAEAEGNANSSLDSVKARLPQVGWAGVVLAGVNPPKYFNVLYEFLPMRQAVKDLKAEDFNKYFKPV